MRDNYRCFFYSHHQFTQIFSIHQSHIVIVKFCMNCLVQFFKKYCLFHFLLHQLKKRNQKKIKNQKKNNPPPKKTPKKQQKNLKDKKNSNTPTQVGKWKTTVFFFFHFIFNCAKYSTRTKLIKFLNETENYSDY